jgi:hypothetical protein
LISVSKKNFANSKNIEENICPFQNIELYLNIASMYELQIVGNASIICFTRKIVICFLTSFPLFVFDTTASPFQNIELYLKMRSKIKRLLFIHLNHRGVTRFEACSILKSALRCAWYNPCQYNTHIFGESKNVFDIEKPNLMYFWKVLNFHLHICTKCTVVNTYQLYNKQYVVYLNASYGCFMYLLPTSNNNNICVNFMLTDNVRILCLSCNA